MVCQSAGYVLSMVYIMIIMNILLKIDAVSIIFNKYGNGVVTEESETC